MATQSVPRIEIHSRLPATVILAAVLCFVNAGAYTLATLLSGAIAAWGDANPAFPGSDRGVWGASFVVALALVFGAVCLVLSLLYALGGLGVLRRSRPWYVATLALLGLGIVTPWVMGGWIFLVVLVWGFS